MKHKVTFLVISLIVIFSLLLGLTASTAQSPVQPEVDLAEPGLSYRYAQTYGTLNSPYVADPDYLNAPVGLFMDGSDNLFVIEEWGFRVLKYDPTPTISLILGTAGHPSWMYGGDVNLFNSPRDVATDNSGNIWVTDGNRVVEFDSNGVFQQQLLDSGAPSSFIDLWGIDFNSAGRMFVADPFNQVVQVYDLTSGTPVYSTTIGVPYDPNIAGCLSDNDHFCYPWRVAVDSLDQLYVADSDNGRVQKCTYSGGWSCTLFDPGLSFPRGIAIDGNDNVYIADTDNGRIRKCVSGTCADFATGTPRFMDLVVDSTGNVYAVTSWDVYTVYKYDSTGLLVDPEYIGHAGVPYLTDASHFYIPLVSTDAQDNILITEEWGHRLIKLDPDGNFLWSFGKAGIAGGDGILLHSPMRVATDNGGNIYVPNRWACRVDTISPDGEFLYTLGIGCGSGVDQINGPTGVAIGNNDTIYVADHDYHRVQIFDISTPITPTYVATIGETGVCGADNDHLCYPSSVALDTIGNVYVADSDNHRIQKFDSNLVWQMTIGTGTPGNQFDQFDYPEGVVVDAQGRIFVSDLGNLRVQVFDSTGAYLTTIGGSAGTNSAQFENTGSVAVDSAGNVYVSDNRNSRIQKYAPGVPGWKQVNLNGFGNPYGGVSSLEIYADQLYAGTGNWVDGGQVWRTSNGVDWSAVSEPGFGSDYAIANRVIIDLIEFKSQLYAGTGWGGSAGQIWRFDDDTGWQQVVADGFGNPDNTSITTFLVFSDTLYAAAGNFIGGLEIWRSSTGNSLSWTPVITAGLGYPANQQVTGFIVFDGYLYLSTEGPQPCQVWRSSNGTIWEPIITDGFGDSNNTSQGGWATLGDYLYIGTNNVVTGAQLWRSSDGINWDPVVEDGFGNLNNIKIESLFTFDGDLLAATQNNVTGMAIMRSVDGSSWSQLGPNGFGDSNNYATLWSNATIAFKDHFYIGTWNPANGGEVWLLKGLPIFLPIIKR